MKMLGPSMSCLPKMYYFLFFYINQVNLSYPHLLDYFPLMSHDDKPILPIYLSNVFAKIHGHNAITLCLAMFF